MEIFVIIAEGLFLALVVVLVLLLITRKKLFKLRDLLGRREREALMLRQTVDDQNKQLRLVRKKLAELQKAPPPTDDQQIQGYKQRIANLEKFKDLYLELEQRLTESDDSQDNREGMDDVLKGVIESQNQLINSLKADLTALSDKYKIESTQTEKLGATISELEVNSEKLRRQLDHVKRQRALAEKDAQERLLYQQRAKQSEATETRLQQELAYCRQQIKQLQTQKPPQPQYGAVRIREIDTLNERLQDRDNEIRRLRQECETVALQYEELAMKSLTLASQDTNLSDEQRAELEELKQKLEQSSSELARKKAECEMLENYYLELESNAELGQAAMEMQSAFAERDALEDEHLALSSQVENIGSKEFGEELVQLRQKLREAETLLNQTRDDYHEIKQQFVEVAQEEIGLRDENKRLREECDQLRRELRELRETQGDISDSEKELEKLRAEYNKMESRYLVLIDKFQDR